MIARPQNTSQHHCRSLSQPVGTPHKEASVTAVLWLAGLQVSWTHHNPVRLNHSQSTATGAAVQQVPEMAAHYHAEHCRPRHRNTRM